MTTLYWILGLINPLPPFQGREVIIVAVYMISYDLHSPTSNREAVEDAIKSLGPWCKYVTTTFLVSTYQNLDTVQNAATRHLDGNDRMIICKVEKPIRGWLSQDQWDWISQNL